MRTLGYQAHRQGQVLVADSRTDQLPKMDLTGEGQQTAVHRDPHFLEHGQTEAPGKRL